MLLGRGKPPAAFAALPAGTLDSLLKPENKAKLVDILTYHVASGAVKSTDLKNDEKVRVAKAKASDRRAPRPRRAAARAPPQAAARRRRAGAGHAPGARQAAR